MTTQEKNPKTILPACGPGCLTFLSVAQRLSLSAKVQTQVSSLQSTRADCQERIHSFFTDKVDLRFDAVPRSRPLVPS